MSSRQKLLLTLSAVISAQGPNPAYVCDSHGNLLLWNGAAGLIFEEFGKGKRDDLNILTYWFLDDSARRFEDWEVTAQHLIANVSSRGNPFIENRMIAELRVESAEFDRLWEARTDKPPLLSHRVVHHRTLGKIEFDSCNFQLIDSDFTMTLMSISQKCVHIELIVALQSCLDLGLLIPQVFWTGR